MANKNTGGLKYEDFKKSLENLSKNLSGDQLEKANATLKKVEESLLAQKEISGLEKITLTNIEKSLGKDGDVVKSLGDVKKSLSKDGDLYKSQAKQAEKLFSLIQKQYKPLKDIKDEKPVTFKEGLKSFVGGAKSIGSRIQNAFQSVKSDPLGSLKNVAGKAERKIANVFDTAYNAGEEVLATDKDFTVKRGRFAQEGVKAGKFKTEEEGIKAAKRLERREAVSEGRKNQLAESEKYGFVNEGLRNKLSKSQERKIQDDPRLKPLAKVQTAPVQSTTTTTANVEKKPSFLSDFGEVGARREMAKVETKPDSQAQKETELTKESRDKNVEADNVESPAEIMAKNSQEDIQLSKDLLETTKEQLTELRAIKEALSDQTRPTESKKETDNAAPVAPAAEESGLSLNPLDFLGRGKGRGFPRGTPKIPGQVGKPSLGGRILGGMKSVAKSGVGKLGGALAIAGGAYSAYTGVSDASDEEQAKLAQIEEAKTSGEISDEEAKKLTNETKNATVEKKGGAVGGGIGAAIGGTLGAIGGGALGSLVMPGVGTAVGGVAGGVAGAAAGEAAGNWLGEKAGKVVNFFSGDKKQAEAKPAETAAGKKSNKIKAGGKEYSSFDELDKALINKEITPMERRNAIKFFQKENPEAYQKEFERREKREVTAKMDDGQVGAMQPAKAESPDMQLDQDIKANRARNNEVAPSRPTTAPSTELKTLELENKDLERDASKSYMSTAPIIMNNSSNNSTTKIMPMKSDPRPNSRGSALDKYLERTSSY